VIHADASAERLGLLRVVVFGAWLVHLSTTSVRGYAELPPELIEPAGLLRWLPMERIVGSPPILVGLQVAGIVLSILCLLGARPWPPIAATATVAILWHDGMIKSFQGFMNHAQVAILVASILLVIAPAADGLTPWREHRERRADRQPPGQWTYGSTLFATALVLSVAYSMIGIRRLLFGGWATFTDGSILRWVAARTDEYSVYGFRVGEWLLDLPGIAVLLPLGMLVVTLLEALSPLALFEDRFRRLWLAGLLPFHVSTLLLMNIFFWENLLLLLVLFVAPRSGKSEQKTLDRPRSSPA